MLKRMLIMSGRNVARSVARRLAQRAVTWARAQGRPRRTSLPGSIAAAGMGLSVGARSFAHHRPRSSARRLLDRLVHPIASRQAEGIFAGLLA